MPTDFPRRQTTSQFRPVLASRANASRNLAGSMLGSSIVILAPVVDISCTTHFRAAKPPSRVIHPGWCSDLRASRFLVIAAIPIPIPIPIAREASPLPHRALKTVATSQEFGLFGWRRTRSICPHNGAPGGLPGRANATIRSAAAIRINSPRSGFGTAPSQPQSVDLPGICL
jgi:hypothetical protein